MVEMTVLRGERTIAVPGCPLDIEFELKRRADFLVEAGAAKYALYINRNFYCTCDSHNQAEELKDLGVKL